MSQPSKVMVIPSQPARLQIGDREISVPTQPLSTEPPVSSGLVHR
jgi:hypothetical protein